MHTVPFGISPAATWLLVCAIALPQAGVAARATVPSASEGDVHAAYAGPTVTLAECIDLALAHGFAMDIERQRLSVAREHLPIARSAFLPNLSMSAGRSGTRLSGDALQPGSRTDDTGLSFGFDQRLLSGATLGLGSQLDRAAADPLPAAYNPAYGHDMTLTLRQPLLRGFGPRINRLDLLGADLAWQQAQLGYEMRALEVIESTERAYYALAGAHERRQVVRTSLRLAEAFEQEAHARQSAGMATRIDVLQARVGVANARAAVLEATQSVQSAQDALLALTGRFALDDAPAGALQVDTAPLVQAQVARADAEASFATALAQQPALRMARIGLQRSDMEVERAADGLKPGLDLDLAYGLGGRDGSRGGAWSDAWDRQRSNWQARLTLTYPLGRVAEKSRHRQSLASRESEALSLQQQEQEVQVQVRDIVRRLDTARDRVEIARLTVDLGEQQYEAERARFGAGLSTSRQVLDAQQDLERARMDLLQVQYDLRIAQAGLHRIEGTALRHHGIQLDAWASDSGAPLPSAFPLSPLSLSPSNPGVP